LQAPIAAVWVSGAEGETNLLRNVKYSKRQRVEKVSQGW